jgi:hypothetical protein
MLEKVIWDDAGEFGGEDVSWVSKEGVLQMYANAQFLIVSVGFVVHENDDSLIMALSYDDEMNQYSKPFRIPKRMIMKRIILEE